MLLVFLPWKLLICCPLRSIDFHQLLCYYEAIRLLPTRRHNLNLQNLVLCLPFHRRLTDLPGMQVLPLCARHALLTPTDSSRPRFIGRLFLPAVWRITSASVLYILRGWIASRFPIAALTLLRLRLNLTSRLWAPRLSTDCSLRFVGQGLPPCCITCTEPAHSPCDILYRFLLQLSRVTAILEVAIRALRNIRTFIK